MPVVVLVPELVFVSVTIPELVSVLKIVPAVMPASVLVSKPETVPV